MAAVRRAAGEGPIREFKYSQEISQMVRSERGHSTKYSYAFSDVRFWRGSGSKLGHRQFG